MTDHDVTGIHSDPPASHMLECTQARLKGGGGANKTVFQSVSHTLCCLITAAIPPKQLSHLQRNFQADAARMSFAQGGMQH
jgi:hypothetical protein